MSMLRLPFLGSLKNSVSIALHLLVSSIAGAVRNAEHVLAFLSDTEISFSWASVEGSGLEATVLMELAGVLR